MKRTNNVLVKEKKAMIVNFTGDQHAFLKQDAEERGISMNAIIRWLVKTYMTQKKRNDADGEKLYGAKDEK